MKMFQAETTAPFALRALKTVAGANGVFDQAERALLGAAANLYEIETPIDGIVSIGAPELAAQVSHPEDRQKVLEDCVLMALADEEATPDEWEVLRSFGAALSISEEKLRQSYDLAREQRLLAQHEMMRRQYAEMLRELSERKGSEGLRLFFHQSAGQKAEDPAVSWRYRRLGLLPKKTLGYELWRHCRSRDFGLPGEVGGLPEPLLYHDLLHVLTGYGTDPDGEMALGAFTAGMTKTPLFARLFFVLLSFRETVSLSTKKLSRAFERGARAADITRGFDLFGQAHRAVAELADGLGFGESSPSLSRGL
jgi:tellurite resistance protein